ncbi:endolytic transglycosylase MltG [Dysgonomonas sp. 511]|uniref:endolytic transglycosylase MltG n=1 Tax=Dysgonomonas sp. 511 TaxID=2302930 RepID=UPI0013D41603|nr:endolytic transglycosylase MltG [Dysgonomonas sp. 511]NDV78674.1 endolytic transglycosylase MltG [Dysgonomonas sp. 511]
MKKTILYIILAFAIVAIGGAVYVYSIFSSGFDIDKTVYIYVDKNKDYERLLAQVKDSAKVESIRNFEWLTSFFDYPDNMRTGRYAVTKDMTVKELVQNLRNGNQSPAKIKFNNIRTKEDFAKRISSQLMLTEDELLSALDDKSQCEELGFDTRTIVAMFIPNTYEFYWDTSVDNFLEKMKREYTRFWNDDRQKKAAEIGLTPIEASILASIVEEECTYSDEYPKVAGLYMNRLNRGQLLQADPTVKYAVGDFSLRRILNKHLETDSPYNTYRNAGLPPGPIRIPSIKGIDAVLNYAKHDYLYMCAKSDFSGYHDFGKTLAEHMANARKYQRALSERGIFK